MAKNPFYQWFSLAWLKDDPDAVIGKLNTLGHRLEGWAQFPAAPFGVLVLQQPVTYAATLTWTPASDGCNALVTLTGACTLSLSSNSLQVGQVCTLMLAQDGTGGRVVTWGGSNISWGLAGAPTLNTTLSTKSILSFLWDGTKFNGALFGTKF